MSGFGLSMQSSDESALAPPWLQTVLESDDGPPVSQEGACEGDDQELGNDLAKLKADDSGSSKGGDPSNTNLGLGSQEKPRLKGAIPSAGLKGGENVPSELFSLLCPDGKSPFELGADDHTIDGISQQLLSMSGGDETKIDQFMNKFATDLGHDAAGGSDQGDDKEADFWKGLHENNYILPAQGSAGNPAGGRWQRWLKSNPEQKARYDELVGQKAKQ